MTYPSAITLDWPRRALSWIRLVHPFPSVLNAAVVALLAIVASDGDPDWRTAALLAATMLCLQCAIGAVNDLMDRQLDAASKPWKPLVSGAVSPTVAVAVAVACALAGLTLAWIASPEAWPLALLGLLIGLGYDLGLKRTPFSALTYSLALPLAPLWVWIAVSSPTPAVVAAVPLGALIGFGLQLANAMQDAETDAAGGVRGTAQWLGPRSSRIVCWAAIGGALALAPVLAAWSGLAWFPFLAAWLVGCCALTASIGLSGMGCAARDERGARVQVAWTLLALSTGVLACGWFVSMPVSS